VEERHIAVSHVHQLLSDCENFPRQFHQLPGKLGHLDGILDMCSLDRNIVPAEVLCAVVVAQRVAAMAQDVAEVDP